MSVIATSLLVYRENSKGQPEVFVRHGSERQPVYGLPYRELSPVSDALECALSIGTISLQMDIPTEDISYEKSALINDTGNLEEKVRVFIVKSRPGSPFEAIAERDSFRGWNYAFIPTNMLEAVWVYPPHIDVGSNGLEFMIANCY